MLPRAGFGNHFFLAQFFCQQHFADAVVDFVRTGVVQIFAFQINFRAAFRQGARMINRAGTADISGLQAFHFGDEIGIFNNIVKTGFDFRQRFG